MPSSTLPPRYARLVIGCTALSAVGAGVVAIASGAISQLAPGGLLILAGVLLAWHGWRLRENCFASVPFWRRLFVGWVAVYILAIVTVGGSAAARWWFFALTACWLTCLLNRPAGKDGATKRSPWLRCLEVAATNLALTLVLGELGLRAFAALGGPALLLDPTLDGYRLEPNRNYSDLLFTNSHGYASREFHREKRAGVRRIAALGDSFAVGVVPQDRNFLTLLEAYLRDAEVYNFGISGAGPREYDAILRSEVWPFQPDLVLVCFFVGNDVTGWWRLPSTSRLDPKSYRLSVLGERTWRLGREALRRRDQRSDEERTRQPLGLPQLSRRTHLEHELERLAICRRSLADPAERSWMRTLEYLDRIDAQCRKRGVPLAIVLIPDEVQVNPELLCEVTEFGSISADDIDLDAPQRRLRAFFAERAVPCLDLSPAFAAVRDTYRPRDTHWNEKGNRLAAEAIADWFKSRRGDTATRRLGDGETGR